MPFKFGVDSSGNYGYYKAGADSVTPFRTGNATAAQVLSGYTFANASSHYVTGTMPNNGAKTASLNCGGSYTIPAGYHNGSGKVTANSLASQTSANATAQNISSGKTAWVNGVKITGTGATPIDFKSGSLTSNYAVSSLTVGSTYILSTAGLENSKIPSIQSGGTELKKVSAFSADDYSGLKTMIASIMFKATATSVVLTNVTLYDRNAWTLVKL